MDDSVVRYASHSLKIISQSVSQDFLQPRRELNTSIHSWWSLLLNLACHCSLTSNRALEKTALSLSIYVTSFTTGLTVFSVVCLVPVFALRSESNVGDVLRPWGLSLTLAQPSLPLQKKGGSQGLLTSYSPLILQMRERRPKGISRLVPNHPQ